jgi:hypothetical protein
MGAHHGGRGQQLLRINSVIEAECNGSGNMASLLAARTNVRRPD